MTSRLPTRFTYMSCEKIDVRPGGDAWSTPNSSTRSSVSFTRNGFRGSVMSMMSRSVNSSSSTRTAYVRPSNGLVHAKTLCVWFGCESAPPMTSPACLTSSSGCSGSVMSQMLIPPRVLGAVGAGAPGHVSFWWMKSTPSKYWFFRRSVSEPSPA